MSKNKTNLLNLILLLPLLIFSLLSYPDYLHAQETQPAATETQNKPTGNLLVDLEFKESDIRDVARAFSRISGINIIVSEEVKTKVTLRVQSMDWKEALNMILGAYNLILVEKENYYIVTTVERRRVIEESGDLKTEVVTLNFVNVDETQKTLTSMLSKRGKMEIDTRTNSLVITDIPEKIEAIKEVAKKLDTKTPQVMIEAMLLTIKINDDQKLGVDWDITHKDRSEREVKQSLKIGGTAGTDYFWQLKYGKTFLSWANLSATVDMLIEQKKAEILANPRVLTLDNLTASIDLTEEVPYTQQSTSTESSSSVSSVQFKEVPVKLYVRPHITQDNHIFMNIKTEQSYRSGYVSGTTQPIIDSRKAETNVMVKDGETVVIGGLRKKEDTSTIDKFPILGDIPLINFFFRKTVKSKINTELIIFVTPYITRDFSLAEKEAEYLNTYFRQEKKKEKELFKEATPFPLKGPALDNVSAK